MLSEASPFLRLDAAWLSNDPILIMGASDRLVAPSCLGLCAVGRFSLVDVQRRSFWLLDSRANTHSRTQRRCDETRGCSSGSFLAVVHWTQRLGPIPLRCDRSEYDRLISVTKRTVHRYLNGYPAFSPVRALAASIRFVPWFSTAECGRKRLTRQPMCPPHGPTIGQPITSVSGRGLGWAPGCCNISFPHVPSGTA